MSGSPERERFLVDTDVDVEVIDLLRRLGFRARNALMVKAPNDDTQLLIWARDHDYILVCHDKHRDAKARYSFYAEMYYRGGRVIRIGGQPGQDALWAVGKLLAQRPTWQEHFRQDSGECVVHPSGCNFNTAAKLFERSTYTLRLPFEDPAVPLKARKRAQKRKRKTTRPLPADRRLL